MKVSILYITLLLIAQTLYSQEKRISFSGIIVDKNSNALEGTTCINGIYGTVSDALGRFEMRANIGDTLRFTSVGYATYLFIVPDTVSSNSYMAAITMSPDTIEMEEVVIIGRYKSQSKTYIQNAHLNMNNVQHDAFSENLTPSASDIQRRTMGEYAASTNKGHVYVGLKLGVGTGVINNIRNLKSEKEYIRPLSLEEIDLVKMLLSKPK